jgi:hypothetical protein
VEVDKAAGTCAAYFTVIGKTADAAKALRSADNVNRAVNFALEELRQYKRDAGDKRMRGVLGTLADDECRKVGIRIH